MDIYITDKGGKSARVTIASGDQKSGAIRSPFVLYSCLIDPRKARIVEMRFCRWSERAGISRSAEPTRRNDVIRDAKSGL
jgi:hypothetical protein